jgi:hypothetical protein
VPAKSHRKAKVRIIRITKDEHTMIRVQHRQQFLAATT